MKTKNKKASKLPLELTEQLEKYNEEIDSLISRFCADVSVTLDIDINKGIRDSLGMLMSIIFNNGSNIFGFDNGERLSNIAQFFFANLKVIIRIILMENSSKDMKKYLRANLEKIFTRMKEDSMRVIEES